MHSLSLFTAEMLRATGAPLTGGYLSDLIRPRIASVYLTEYCNSKCIMCDFWKRDRNPTEPKIRRQDYEFLKWAMAESQRRRPINTLKRSIVYQWQRMRRVTPAKVMHKLGLAKA